MGKEKLGLQSNKYFWIYMLMDGITLYDSYEKHARGYDDPLEAQSTFIRKFIDNEFYATGGIPGEYSIKRIDIEFWQIFKKMLSIGTVAEGMIFDIIHDRIIRMEFGNQKIVYENIVVYEEPYKNPDQSHSLKKNAPGRKPDKDKWEITVAEAFRIYFENGFPRSRAEFVKQIEEAVFALGSTDPLGHETLIKLVRRIYDRCGL
ncbi:MAG: hypothetical protein KGL63_14285 [Betaproteobacteria bacterium]|nr:hypothetical protein [Betaproteobacteria bacterium]